MVTMSSVGHAGKAPALDFVPVTDALEHIKFHQISCCYSFQIWFYTNDIFKNAGIPEPYIQYTTVGTGAIEVISGMLGVRSTPYLPQSHDIIHPVNMRWHYYTWLMSICNSLIHSN